MCAYERDGEGEEEGGEEEGVMADSHNVRYGVDNRQESNKRNIERQRRTHTYLHLSKSVYQYFSL